MNTRLLRGLGQASAKVEQFEAAGIHVGDLASRLQVEGAVAFAKSWHRLLTRIADKRSKWKAA